MAKKYKIGKAKRVADISFEGTDFDGLEVRCNLDLPLRTLLEIHRLMESDDQVESIEANTIWCDKILESWNLTDDEGIDIPANSKSALAVAPARLLAALISKWSELVTEPPANLSKPQNDTPILETLATLSQSN
jgi:hypothetical protein